MARIGFIGLGNMGLPMAANLKAAGHDVTGYDLAASNMEAGEGKGVAKAASATDCAANADFVITMLPAGKDTIAVYASGILEAATKGTIFIDSSTIDVTSAAKAHELAKAAGMGSLDAPVSGGVGGAQAGSLTFMAGGSVDDFTAGKPILAAMGKRIVHCGDAGAGQAAKICNNMILGISMIGVCEAFALGEKLGLSHEALYDVASTSSGQCWSITSYCPVPGPVPASPANNDYKPGFAAQLMLKDLRLSQEAAAAVGAATPMGAEAARHYQDFADSGNGGVDFSGIINAIRQRSS